MNMSDTLTDACKRLSHAIDTRRRIGTLDRTYITRIVPKGATIAILVQEEGRK